jgi:hypothetical protein
MENLSPEGALEGHLAEKIALLMWRSRRIAVLEAALFTWIGQDQANNDLDGFDAFAPALTSAKKFDSELSEMGRLLQALLDKNLLDKLNRYQATLANQLKMALDQLMKVKEARLAKGEVCKSRSNISSPMTRFTVARRKETLPHPTQRLVITVTGTPRFARPKRGPTAIGWLQE